ncbi:MAG: hypothetical protein SF028_08890 [Candidatus Sumerlaeia bacterium]|nr:hypothetical protein [Candidatus Sumerlaeia bacterium]
MLRRFVRANPWWALLAGVAIFVAGLVMAIRGGSRLGWLVAAAGGFVAFLALKVAGML